MWSIVISSGAKSREHKSKIQAFGMLQNMYFGREIFTWSHLYFSVIDFKKVESTPFYHSSTLIGVECIKRKMGYQNSPKTKQWPKNLLVYNREEAQI